MVFMNIDEHTVRCIIKSSEITQMGYDPRTLMQEQDPETVQSFMQDIVKRANDAGVPITEHHRAVQSMVLPGHHLVLNFSDAVPEQEDPSSALHTDEESFPEEYMIVFPDLDCTELFCKAAPFPLPGRLFRNESQYYLYLNGHGKDAEDLNRLLLLACEFRGDVRPDRHLSSYLTEHGEVILSEDPIEQLKAL